MISLLAHSPVIGVIWKYIYVSCKMGKIKHKISNKENTIVSLNLSTLIVTGFVPRL